MRAILFFRCSFGMARVETEICSMPGVYQLSVGKLVREAKAAMKSGVNAVILFGIPAEKDPIGLENFSKDGIVQQAIRADQKRNSRDGGCNRCVHVRIYRSWSLRNIKYGRALSRVICPKVMY